MSRSLALVDSDAARKYEISGAPAIAPLLETKLYVPRARSTLVARPRLTAALRDREARKLTLIAAPAGFGKTTLVAGWLAEAGIERAAWVSLDASDNDPRLFWAYVISALQRTRAEVGTGPTALLSSTRPASIDSVVAALINDLASVDADTVLVLDDYHVIHEPEIHRTLTLFLDRLPPRVHLVIASRSEPPLGLPRLRARDELTELRAGDLRFSVNEASAFFTQVMAIHVSPDDVSTLEHRTEGWIAGLKLAALSMKGRADTRQFVDGFSGDNRHIADYLVEEVLRAEPEHIRRFLLATSVLDRLSGPLCDAVLGESRSHVILEELERRNLFVIALDDRREWYRYHHLFADVLQKQSLALDPDGARHVHLRASEWYERTGSSSLAVQHALAAHACDRAAELLERTWPEKDRSYESATWLSRVKTLPEDVVRARPVLAAGFAWALLNAGELDAADHWLRETERSLEQDRATLIIGDQRRFQVLATELSTARIYLAQSRGEIPGTLEHAQRGLASLPPDDHEGRATALALVALAHWGRGELEAAHRTFSDALGEMRARGHELDVIRGAFVLGDLRAAQGRLGDARDAYDRGLALATESAQHATAETDELHLGLSELHCEWNDLATATTHLDTIARRSESAAHKGNRQRWCVAQARVRQARGDLTGALALLDEAERHERRDPLPRIRPIAALKARVRIAQGDLDAAAGWARDARVTVDDELSYLREFEHITLARLLIGRRDATVLPHLDRLEIEARAGGRMGSVIEILVLQSLARHTLDNARGNARGAMDALAEALTFAERERFLRVFLDEGDRMRELLRTATARGLAGGYTRHVLAAFDAPVQHVVVPVVDKSVKPPREALTTRELEILRLIAGGLRNQEIADHLSISAATVKRHIANAYAKLEAGHRTEALVRAAELKLL